MCYIPIGTGPACMHLSRREWDSGMYRTSENNEAMYIIIASDYTVSDKNPVTAGIEITLRVNIVPMEKLEVR
jgi:hypothetical protein